jgi:hypothetical protein
MSLASTFNYDGYGAWIGGCPAGQAQPGPFQPCGLPPPPVQPFLITPPNFLPGGKDAPKPAASSAAIDPNQQPVAPVASVAPPSVDGVAPSSGIDSTSLLLLIGGALLLLVFFFKK